LAVASRASSAAPSAEGITTIASYSTEGPPLIFCFAMIACTPPAKAAFHLSV
jgi:hypothetical protein